MKLLKPDFYDGFACIASRCRDTCCAGWEIEVDEETLKNTGRCREISAGSSVPGSLRKRTEPTLPWPRGEDAHF